MRVDDKKVTQKHHRSFYNGKCSSYRKTERNGDVSWLMKPIHYRIPRYRRKEIYGQYRKDLKEIIKEL